MELKVEYIKYKSKIVFIICIIAIVFICIDTYSVYAADEDAQIDEMLDEIDDTKINAMLQDFFSEKITFKEYVKQIIYGERKLDGNAIKELVLKQFAEEVTENKKSMITVFMLCIMAALFSNFTKVFEKSGVAEIGFYILYLLLIAILFKAYSETFSIATDLLNQMITFMKVLLPAFFVTIIMAKGASTALVFYEFILTSIFIVETVVLKVILPLCSLYVVINLINQISKEDLFSKMADLTGQLVTWIMKWMIAILLGINTIHSILTPAVDKFKNTSINQAVSSLPGIGNTLGGVWDMLLGCGVLIKNGVGATILILLVLLVVTPLVKLCACMLMYKLTVALIQPISNKRMTNLVECVANGTILLIKGVVNVLALFFLTMAILTIAAG